MARGARLSTFAFPVDGQETLQQNSDHPWEIQKTLLNNLDIIPSVQLQVRQAQGAALRYMSVLKKWFQGIFNTAKEHNCILSSK